MPLGPDPAPRPSNRQGETPAAAYAQAERVHELLREISRLLESSMRAVERAKTDLGADAAVLASHGSGDVGRQLLTAAEGLERMAELVHSAMQSATKPLGSPTLHKSRPVTLGEAVHHAADVLAPLAATHGVRVAIDIGPALAIMPAGALYTVLLNGLQNAIESVARRGGRGAVRVSMRAEAAPPGVAYGRDSRDWYLLEITDDGAGLPKDPSRCFDLGFTTKPKGSGVGLAVARNVVKGMGGTIELSPRADGGATLRVRFPSLTSASNMAMGGAA